MATVATCRDGLKTRLATLTNPAVVAYDVATGAERLTAGQAVAIVFPRGLSRATAGGKYDVSFVVEIHVGLARGLAQAQDKLDALIDPKATTGVEYAIEADKTLGGIVDSTMVGGFERYGYGQLNSTEPNTLMAIVPVEVIGFA